MESQPYLLDDILRTQRELITAISQFDPTFQRFLGNVYVSQIDTMADMQEGDFVYVKDTANGYEKGDLALYGQGQWSRISQENFFAKVGDSAAQIAQNAQSIQNLTEALSDDNGLMEQLIAFITDNADSLSGFEGLDTYKGQITSLPPPQGNTYGDWYLVTESFTYDNIDLNPGDVLKWGHDDTTQTDMWIIIQELVLFRLLDNIDMKINQAQADILDEQNIRIAENSAITTDLNENVGAVADAFARFISFTSLDETTYSLTTLQKVLTSSDPTPVHTAYGDYCRVGEDGIYQSFTCEKGDLLYHNGQNWAHVSYVELYLYAKARMDDLSGSLTSISNMQQEFQDSQLNLFLYFLFLTDSDSGPTYDPAKFLGAWTSLTAPTEASSEGYFYIILLDQPDPTFQSGDTWLYEDGTGWVHHSFLSYISNKIESSKTAAIASANAVTIEKYLENIANLMETVAQLDPSLNSFQGTLEYADLPASLSGVGDFIYITDRPAEPIYVWGGAAYSAYTMGLFYERIQNAIEKTYSETMGALMQFIPSYETFRGMCSGEQLYNIENDGSVSKILGDVYFVIAPGSGYNENVFYHWTGAAFSPKPRADMFNEMKAKIDQIAANDQSLQDLANFAPSFVSWIVQSQAEITEMFSELATYQGTASSLPGGTPAVGDWYAVETGFEYGGDPIVKANPSDIIYWNGSAWALLNELVIFTLLNSIQGKINAEQTARIEDFNAATLASIDGFVRFVPLKDLNMVSYTLNNNLGWLCGADTLSAGNQGDYYVVRDDHTFSYGSENYECAYGDILYWDYDFSTWVRISNADLYDKIFEYRNSFDMNEQSAWLYDFTLQNYNEHDPPDPSLFDTYLNYAGGFLDIRPFYPDQSIDSLYLNRGTTEGQSYAQFNFYNWTNRPMFRGKISFDFYCTPNHEDLWIRVGGRSHAMEIHFYGGQVKFFTNSQFSSALDIDGHPITWSADHTYHIEIEIDCIQGWSFSIREDSGSTYTYGVDYAVPLDNSNPEGLTYINFMTCYSPAIAEFYIANIGIEYLDFYFIHESVTELKQAIQSLDVNVKALLTHKWPYTFRIPETSTNQTAFDAWHLNLGRILNVFGLIINLKVFNLKDAGTDSACTLKVAQWDGSTLSDQATYVLNTTPEKTQYLSIFVSAGLLSSSVDNYIYFQSTYISEEWDGAILNVDVLPIQLPDATPTTNGLMSASDKAKLDGIGEVSTSATANTIAQRNASGDIYARLFRPTYTDQTTISGALAYRINTSDNYIRFCNSKYAIRNYLGITLIPHAIQLNNHTTIGSNPANEFMYNYAVNDGIRCHFYIPISGTYRFRILVWNTTSYYCACNGQLYIGNDPFGYYNSGWNKASGVSLNSTNMNPGYTQLVTSSNYSLSAGYCTVIYRIRVAVTNGSTSRYWGFSDPHLQLL